jgi:hypothetical protein
MSEMKKKILAGLGACALSLTIGGFASANYSAQSTLDVPWGNASVYGEDHDVPNNKKDTESDMASFYTFTNTAGDMDARIVNSNKVSRSSWFRNCHSGTELYASTTAAKSYNYNMQVSSDLNQVGTDSISFKYSPDKE